MPVENFLKKENIVAVVGVSANPGKWGYKIYKELKSIDFKIYAINPKYKKIENDKCYPNLKSLPEKVDVVITIVPPQITERIIVKECKKLGVSKVWMQPGSESEDAIKFCQNNNIDVVSNTCFVVNGLREKFNGL